MVIRSHMGWAAGVALFIASFVAPSSARGGDSVIAGSPPEVSAPPPASGGLVQLTPERLPSIFANRATIVGPRGYQFVVQWPYLYRNGVFCGAFDQRGLMEKPYQTSTYLINTPLGLRVVTDVQVLTSTCGEVYLAAIKDGGLYVLDGIVDSDSLGPAHDTYLWQ